MAVNWLTTHLDCITALLLDEAKKTFQIIIDIFVRSIPGNMKMEHTCTK